MNRKISLIFLSLFLSVPAFALTIPEKPQSRVNDYAGLLSSQAQQSLEATLENFEKTTSTQVVVAIFESLEGGSLEDFSIRLADQWKIGSKNKDNGVILLIFKNDRAMRIEVGYGLEGVLTDALSSQIIRNQIVPSFRSGDFDKGVLDGVNAILAATRGEYQTEAAAAQDPFEKYKAYAFFLLILYLLVPLLCYGGIAMLAISIFGLLKGGVIAIPVIITLVAFRALFSASQTLSGRSGRPGGFGGGWGGGSLGGGGFGGGGFSGGGGGFGGGGSSGRW